VLSAGEVTDDEDHADIVANGVFFIVAGHETTSTLIAAGADLLWRHPAQRAMLDADPGRWPAAVEEMLRYASPTSLARQCPHRQIESLPCPNRPEAD
jgi:cytochrome P450